MSNKNKKKSIRCITCNKKIKSVLPIACRCENFYCILCKYEHNCSYDYKKEFKEKLEKSNPEVKHQKLEKI